MKTLTKVTASTILAREANGAPGLVEIKGTRYAYRRFPGGAGSGCKCVVRLFKTDGFDGDAYDVAVMHGDRVDCSCADAVYRKTPTGRICKHGRAVCELGLDQFGPSAKPVRKIVAGFPGLSVVYYPEGGNSIEGKVDGIGWVVAELADLTDAELSALDGMIPQ